MKKLMGTLIVVAILSFSVNLNAQDLPLHKAESKIDAVTVYASGAGISRSAEVELKKGNQVVAFENLPVGIYDDSIRAFATGSPKAKIIGVELKLVYLDKPYTERARKLVDDLTKLGDDLEALQKKTEGYDTEIEFAKGIAKSSSNMGSGKEMLDAEKLMKIAQFVRETIEKANTEILNIKKEMRSLREKQNVIQGELNKIRSQRRKQSKSVLIILEATEQIKVKCTLTYRIGIAYWLTAYDVRYIEDSKEVELVYYSVIHQGTGEDWKNVSLTLSTSTPTTSVSMPGFSPTVVYPTGQHVVPGQTYRQTQEQRKSQYLLRSNYLKASNTVVIDQSFPGNREFLTAISKRFTSVTFKHEKPETIQADGREHKSILATLQFPAKMDYVTFPSQAPFVYLRATLTNNSALPILPGSMSVFVGSSFIGKSMMKVVAPNEKFELFFGTDKELKASRRLIKMKEEGPTAFRSSRKVTKDYRIELQNFKKKTSVKVIVFDSMPVSWSQNVKIELVEKNHGAKGPNELGKLEWEITLKPGEKVVIEFSYTIEHPQSVGFNLESWSEKRYRKQMEYNKKK